MDSGEDKSHFWVPTVPRPYSWDPTELGLGENGEYFEERWRPPHPLHITQKTRERNKVVLFTTGPCCWESAICVVIFSLGTGFNSREK